MTRGRNAKVGDTMTNKNGYHNTRTAEGWILTHRLVAEKKLGRKLRPNEMVKFVNGDRTDLHPSNIIVIVKGGGNLLKRKAQIEVRMEELQAELDEINNLLEAKG